MLRLHVGEECPQHLSDGRFPLPQQARPSGLQEPGPELSQETPPPAQPIGAHLLHFQEGKGEKLRRHVKGAPSPSFGSRGWRRNPCGVGALRLALLGLGWGRGLPSSCGPGLERIRTGPVPHSPQAWVRARLPFRIATLPTMQPQRALSR